MSNLSFSNLSRLALSAKDEDVLLYSLSRSVFNKFRSLPASFLSSFGKVPKVFKSRFNSPFLPRKERYTLSNCATLGEALNSFLAFDSNSDIVCFRESRFMI